MKSDCNKATAVSRINNGYIWIFCQHRLYLNGIKEQSVHGLFANCWGFFVNGSCWKHELVCSSHDKPEWQELHRC